MRFTHEPDGGLLEDSSEELYENAPCGYFSALPDGAIVKVNRTFLSWTGYGPDELTGGKRFQDLLTGGGRIFYETHYAPLLRMQGTVREIALDVVRADGTRLPVLINSVLKYDDAGEPLVTRTTVFNATDRKSYERELMRARRLEREARVRVEHLQRLTEALSPILMPAEIASNLVAALVAGAGADFAAAALRSSGEEELELLSSHGLDVLGTRPLFSDAAAAEALETGEASFFESVAAGTLPGLSTGSDSAVAAALLPLVVDRRSIGLITLGWAKERGFEADERKFLLACAAQASQALERARLHADTAAAARRSALMAETTHALIAVKTAAERAERLARAAVPEIADAARVQLLGSDGHQAIDVAAGDMSAGAVGEELARRALETGGPQLASEPAADYLAMPLRTPGAMEGTLTVMRTGGGRAFTAGELPFLAELADRSALALENARLYEQERDVAHTLQLSMRASEPLDDQRFAVATGYSPAVATLEVGGDWYDMFTLGADCVAVVVGDVVGRGIGAATAMGQLRSATRALAIATDGPAEVLDRLDTFSHQIGHAARVATLAYADIDLTNGRMRYACAGHPPPLLMDAGEQPRLLWDGRSTPLGAGLDLGPRPEAEQKLFPGSRLLLYTDGLVERRDEPLDRGLDRLAAAFAARRDKAVESVVEGLEQTMRRGDDNTDDVCLLCFSLEP